MWSRGELKAKGKAAFKANYWPCVLAAIVLALVTVSGGGSVASQRGNVSSATQELEQQFAGMDPAVVGAIVVTVLGAVLMVGTISTLFDIFVINPLEVGCRRFFLVNGTAPASLSEIVSSFRNGYFNVVLTTFVRDLFLTLWTLLFIIPGIVKAYSYRLVPYILAEHPDMGPTEAITLSRKMMDGNKMNAFLLDLSFLGWDLVSICTLGIAGIFYVNPYAYATAAELYTAIKESNPR